MHQCAIIHILSKKWNERRHCHQRHHHLTVALKHDFAPVKPFSWFAREKKIMLFIFSWNYVKIQLACKWIIGQRICCFCAVDVSPFQEINYYFSSQKKWRIQEVTVHQLYSCTRTRTHRVCSSTCTSSQNKAMKFK